MRSLNLGWWRLRGVGICELVDEVVDNIDSPTKFSYIIWASRLRNCDRNSENVRENEDACEALIIVARVTVMLVRSVEMSSELKVGKSKERRCQNWEIVA